MNVACDYEAPMQMLTTEKYIAAGPAEGLRKILKHRSNLRLYPVDFGNKLCILIFIILLIWPNFSGFHWLLDWTVHFGL